MLPPGGPCTSDTDSSPPAIITGTLSTSTRWAAIEMVCRPDEQKRLTVTPETLTGAPARIAETRATLEPVVPSGAAQPRITSSTSAEVDLGALGGMLDDMRAHVGAVGVVEDAAERLADRRAGGGDDDGVGHDDVSS